MSRPLKRSANEASTSSSSIPGSKKTRFVDPSEDPVNFAEQVDNALEDHPQTRRKGKVNTEGYDSDSSDDGEGVVNSRKKKDNDDAGDEEDEDDVLFADPDKAKTSTEDSAKKKDPEYMRLGDIEGQVFGQEQLYGDEEFDSDDDPDDPAALERKRKEENGFELTQFNMREELEEGKMEQDGTYTRTFDEHAVHDKWMDGVDEKEMRLARRRKRQADRVQKEKMAAEEREIEQMGGQGALEQALLAKLKKGETVLEALARLGAQSKRKSAKKTSEKSTKHTAEIEDITHLTSTIMSLGDTDIYSKTYEELVRHVRSLGQVEPDWVPPSADVLYEYKWDIPGAATNGETFGPFKEDELKAWYNASYFGPGGEKVKIRPVKGDWGDWDDTTECKTAEVLLGLVRHNLNMGRLAEMQRKLLEQMMGPEAMGVVNANLSWWDEKVCRNFLCGTCPHALFTNTKMDLGACPKSHTDRLKTEFVAAKEADPSDPRFARFQAEYEQNIFAFVDECDRRIRQAHRRLEKTPEENAKTTNLMREIAEIELAIQGGTEKIEQLGDEGRVEDSMREMAAIEALKAEKTDKERELQQLTDTSGASGHQKLRVCDVCGAYLSVLDSDRRLADHFGGKMHLGYHELRNMLAQFKEDREKRRNASSANGPSGPRTAGADSRRDDYRDRAPSSRHDDPRRRDRSRSPGRGGRKY